MPTPVEQLTHDEIAEIGANWLRGKGYPVAFANMTSATNGEQPDALGFNAYGESFLLEAKTSRSDFKADLKKLWRSRGKKAVGDFRGYITPKGLLKPEEIPYGWWLLEVHGKTKPVVKVIKGKVKKVKREKRGGYTFTATVPELLHCDSKELYEFHGSNVKDPLTWLIKIIRRAHEDGLDLTKYAQANK